MDIGAFEWAQGLLRGLLISLHDRVPSQSLEQLSELIDAGELPMALDVLLKSMEHHQVIPASDERELLVGLAERLAVASPFLDSLT